MAKIRKKNMASEPFKLGSRGYTDAPLDIEKAMKKGPPIDQLFPENTSFELKQPGPAENRKIAQAWKRYCIKDHERGHRPPLSLKFKIATRRFNTCTTLPENVYTWLKAKKSRADYLRSLLLKEYKKTEGH